MSQTPRNPSESRTRQGVADGIMANLLQRIDQFLLSHPGLDPDAEEGSVAPQGSWTKETVDQVVDLLESAYDDVSAYLGHPRLTGGAREQLERKLREYAAINHTDQRLARNLKIHMEMPNPTAWQLDLNDRGMQALVRGIGMYQDIARQLARLDD